MAAQRSTPRTPVIKPARAHTAFKIGIGLTSDLSLNKRTLKFAGLLLKALLIYSGFQYTNPLPTIVQSGVLTPEPPYPACLSSTGGGVT